MFGAFGNAFDATRYPAWSAMYSVVNSRPSGATYENEPALFPCAS